MDGKNITINFTSPEVMRVAKLWGDMLKAGVLSPVDSFTSDWNTALGNGSVACWPTAVWGAFISGSSPDYAGKWQVYPMPQDGRRQSERQLWRFHCCGNEGIGASGRSRAQRRDGARPEDRHAGHCPPERSAKENRSRRLPRTFAALSYQESPPTETIWIVTSSGSISEDSVSYT